MATPAELVRTIARVTGVPETTVINHDRNLAKAGLRTVGGRGTGAAKMTVRDARNLLLAVAGAPAVKDSVSAAQEHADLIPELDSKRSCWELPFAPIPELTTLPSGHSFGDALAALICSAVSGSMNKYFNRSAFTFSNDSFQERYNGIEVDIINPYKFAKISIYQLRYSIENGMVKDPIEEIGYSRFKNWVGYSDSMLGDMININRFTHRTIIVLGKILKT